MVGKSRSAVLIPVDVKVNVSRVRVAGLNRTKNDIVVECVKDLLKATSIQELFEQLQESLYRLEELKLFRRVSVHLDTDKRWSRARSQSKGEGPRQEVGSSNQVEQDAVEVMFVVKELNWYRATIGANAGTQSGDASISFGLRNLFGRAEEVTMSSSTTLPHWGHNVELQFSKPYYKDIKKKVFVGVGTTDTKLPFSGCQEHNTGAAANVVFPSHLGHHTLGFGCQWRQLFGFDSNVPLSIRRQAGHSVKSFIKHTMESDERDDRELPTAGYCVKMTQEVAGFGGDTIFGKAEMKSEVYKELLKNWVLSWTVWGGVMRAYAQTKLTDKFFLGGGTSLRGFGLWGVGPRQNGYSLGGSAYWASGLHLYNPLPYVTHPLLGRIRIHSFATAGNLVECKTLPTFGDLSRNIRCSCGVGLQFRLGTGQIELNYALPLRAQASDLLQPGLQFGVGIDML